MRTTVILKLAVLCVLLVSILSAPTYAFIENKSICEQISRSENISKIGYVIIHPSPTTNIETIKNTHKISVSSILGSSGLRHPDEMLNSECLVIPEKEGVFKIANLHGTLDYLLAAFGVSHAEFIKYNHAASFNTKDGPILIFLPTVPSYQINRRYVFPITGAILIKKYVKNEIDSFTGFRIRSGIKLIGKKYDREILAIDDGTVVFVEYDRTYKSDDLFAKDRIVVEQVNNIRTYYDFIPSKIFREK